MSDERRSAVQFGAAAAPPAHSAPSFDLLLISDAAPRLFERVAQALRAAEPGRVAVLMREPQLRTDELVTLGRELRTLCDEAGAALLVSDRVDVALAIDADGVQLPESGFTPDVARSLLGLTGIVGASRHDRIGIETAGAQGADYATLSPVHAVSGKGTPLGIAGFAAKVAGTSIPVYALGGVRVEHVPALLGAGARGVAVMREVLSARDPAERTAQLLEALATP